jgi:hypothetical protein
MMAHQVEKAPHGDGVVFTLDSGAEIQVLHWGDSIQVTNVSRGRPNTSGLSVRVRKSNQVTVSEAR